MEHSGKLELTWTNKHLRRGKELAAKRWANHVSAQTGTEWRYLLVGETDVAEARGSGGH